MLELYGITLMLILVIGMEGQDLIDRLDEKKIKKMLED